MTIGIADRGCDPLQSLFATVGAVVVNHGVSWLVDATVAMGDIDRGDRC